MKDTFKAIQFDRKQRVAFFVILLLILIGSLINIKGFVSDRNQMEEVINLEEVITQKYYYKKFYKSKYKKSYQSKSNNYSSTKESKSSHNIDEKPRDKLNYQRNKKVDTQNIKDTINQVIVPADYSLEERETELETEKQSLSYTISDFDPNIATKDELMLMFLPERWIDNVIAYRLKGGIYREKEDIKKLYTTTDVLYDQIESHLTITKDGITILEDKLALEEESANQAWLEEVISTSQLLDINGMNEETWVKLPKVTQSLSRKINKYKNLLGGYHRVEQLLEVYDLDQATYKAILPYLTCEPIVEYIDINTDDISRLNKHPYIGYKKAKVIMRYRNQHGIFETVDQVKKVGVWKSGEFELLKPYLSIGI